MSSMANGHYYLPVNDDAMRWGIYTTGIGRCMIPPGSAYPPQIHPRLYSFRWAQGRTLPEFTVVFINHGRGVFESEASGTVEIPEFGVFFLFPGVWHRYRPLSETGWTERWFSFNGELAHRLMDARLLQPENPVRRIADTSVLEAFDEIFETILYKPSGNSILLSLHILGLLGKIVEKTATQLPSSLDAPTRGDDDLVAQAITIIWTRGHQPLSVEQIAHASGVTRRTLERRFQQTLGHSIVDEIIDCRMNRAKRLLQETAMPIKYVAYLSGFPSAERMRVAFVERENVSPAAYREKIVKT